MVRNSFYACNKPGSKTSRERKSWNHYIPCSLDNNKQGVSEKISLTEKNHPMIHSFLPTTTKFPNNIVWGEK